MRNKPAAKRLESSQVRCNRAWLSIAMGWLAMSVPCAGQDVKGTVAPNEVRAVIKQHCLGCHTGPKAKGGLDLAILSEQAVSAKTLPKWIKIQDAIKEREMPPEGEKPLSVEANETLLGWIEQRMADAVRAHANDPGPVVIRRLTRSELDRTLDSLTIIPLHASALLPGEGAGGEGFANVGSVQMMTPENLEAFLSVAKYVADRLIVSSVEPRFGPSSCVDGEFVGSRSLALRYALRRNAWLEDVHVRLIDGASRVRHGAALDTVAADVRLPADVVQTAKDFLVEPQGGDLSSLKGKEDWTADIAAVRQAFAKLPPAAKTSSPEYRAQITAMARTTSSSPRSLPASGKATPTIDAFVRIFRPNLGVPAELVRLSEGKAGTIASASLLEKEIDLDRASKYLRVGHFEEFQQTIVAARETVILELAAQKKGKVPDIGAIRKRQADAESVQRQWLIDFAAKAWRRALSSAETKAVGDFYDASRSRKEGHADALRLGVLRVLSSPNFWYRSERSDMSVPHHAVSGPELAIRLSYFLWAGPPDDALRARGADGSLLKDEVLRSKVRRLLADPRAEGFVSDFFLTWFEMSRFLVERNPDAVRFPGYTPALVQSMHAEVHASLADIIRNNRPLEEMVVGSWTYLDGRLAKHFGIPNVYGSLVRRVDVHDHGRGGLLAQGAFLVTSSYSLRTSPVKRGSWILQDLLGRKLPPPPPDAGQLPEDDRLPDNLTVRARLEKHRRVAACASCHNHIDPLGFALEGFDVIGRRRTIYKAVKGQKGLPVDDIGQTSKGRKIVGHSGLQAWLKDEKPRLYRQFSTKLTGYALGRGVDLTDRPLIDRMVAVGIAEHGRIVPMIETLVFSDQFRKRRGSAAAPNLNENP